MKRIGIFGLALVAACALSAGVASSAWAEQPELTGLPYICLRIDLLAGLEGFYTDSHCSNLSLGGVYELAKPEHKLNGELWCARPIPLHQGTGLWGDSACEKLKRAGEFVKVEGFPLGPLYVVELKPLEAGETTNAIARNLGDFTLHDTASGEPEILCTGLAAPTTLLGGDPGKSVTEIQFSGCTASGSGGSGTCDANSKGSSGGNIAVSADDELVYTGSLTLAEKEEGPLGDLFTSAGGGSTFVTLDFEALGSGKCPSLAAGEVKVNGSVIGLVEPVDTNSTEGMLRFPKTAVKEGWRLLSTGHVEETKASLKSFGGTSTELGLADVKLESGGEWGVLTL